MDANSAHRKWVNRSGEFSPKYYVYYGPNETSEAIRRVFGEQLDASVSILELGYGPGRHPSHLREHGFENPHGVDVNPDCFGVTADTYPDLTRCGMSHANAIGEIVEEFSSGQFGAAYSIEVLQYVCPGNTWVFEVVTRDANDYVATAENEGDQSVPPEDCSINGEEHDFPLCYRDQAAVLDPLGFEQAACEYGDRDTCHVFCWVD